MICCLASVIADDVASLFDRMLGSAAAADDDRTFEFLLTDNDEFIVNASADRGEMAAVVTTIMDTISKLLLLAEALLLVANLMVTMCEV